MPVTAKHGTKKDITCGPNSYIQRALPLRQMGALITSSLPRGLGVTVAGRLAMSGKYQSGRSLCRSGSMRAALLPSAESLSHIPLQ
jgi:hypothetical protein